MTFYGILIGVAAFIIIGIFHPIVIKSEYYFSKKCWPVFLVMGLVTLIISILVKDVNLSTILGILGFTMLWSIHEIHEQSTRVEKGWFPQNPNRK